jgi:hypothetical protein
MTIGYDEATYLSFHYASHHKCRATGPGLSDFKEPVMPRNHVPLLSLHRGVDLLGNAFSARPQVAAHKRSPATRPGLFARIDRWFWRQRQRALEAHLAQSQDVYELERRIRDLERNAGSRYY